MKSYLKHLLLIALTWSTMGTFGQYNYKEGKIITLQNDTIFGLIKDGSKIKNSKVCIFKENKKAEPVKYLPADIKSYYISSGKYYSSQQYYSNNQYKDRFFDILLEGEVNLYYYHKYRNLSFFIQKKGDKLVGLSNENISLGRPVGNSVAYHEQYNVQLHLYRDTLFSVFSDYPSMKNLIYATDYDQKSLVNITKYYLKETCTSKNCITYERDLSILKPSFGVFTGLELSSISFSEYNVESKLSNAIQVGMFYNIPMALISNRFSFQFELIWNSINNQNFTNDPNKLANLNITSNKISLPLLIKYKLSKNKFASTIGLGKEFASIYNSKIKYEGEYLRNDGIMDFGELESTNYRYSKGAWFFDLEFSYKLNQKLTIFSGIRLQRQDDLIITDKSENRLTFAKASNKPGAYKYQTNMAVIRVGVSF
ncbi:MAG: outer membrane beta-barrel protein [Salinivirgaceae bacterium]|jgi:hypothetical protein|nr:outer membrane beta-barrel protein [Salinivirgaceae bacterium]